MSWLLWQLIWRLSLFNLFFYHYSSVNGNDYLRDQNIPYESNWDFWQNIVALLSMAVIAMIGTYIQLRRMKKLR